MTKSPKLEIYKAKDGWRWRLKSSNGKIVCIAGESFSRKPTGKKVWLTISGSTWNCKTVVSP